MIDEDRVRMVLRFRVAGANIEHDRDCIVREEPLEIRIGGVPLAVVMRTPGDDLELVRGFLHTEGILRTNEIASLRHCTEVSEAAAEDNVVQVVVAAGVGFEIAEHRRTLYAGSSCGMCGKATIDRIVVSAPKNETQGRIDAHWIHTLPSLLRSNQTIFDATGGLHAAALVEQNGGLRVVREDIGRHNAVDKVIGWGLEAGVDFAGLVLVVSSRIGFEIAQKAHVAGIPAVVAISAPSSLAVELAERVGLTVIGFVRDGSFSIYAGAARIARELDPTLPAG